MAGFNETTAAKRGARPAEIDWPEVLARHQRWLRAVAYARLRDAEGVDEVLQEVALAAVRQAAPLRDASKAAPWLYRLTVRQVLLYRRRRGRQRKLTSHYADHRHAVDQTMSAPDPLHWLVSDERRALVRKALHLLAERDMEILLLKYSENWSYGQIATRLGISHSAVESRLHRARSRLRRELASLNVVEATS